MRVALVVGVVPATVAHAGADIVRNIVALAPARPHSYDQYIGPLEQLAASDRIHVETIGRSVEGRQLVLAMAQSPAHAGLPADKRPPCLLIVARQHGTESSGTEAVLAILRYFATTGDPVSIELLNQLTIATVPMANPDGVVRRQRRNAAGVDLNRDWDTLSQPETRAIAELVGRLKPLATIDMHELPASSTNPAFAESFIQTFGSDASIPNWLSDDCRASSTRIAYWMPRYNLPVNLYYDYSTDLRSLYHRYMSLVRGVPAYLFEAKTGDGRPLAQRVSFHVLGALVIGNHLIHTYYNRHEDSQPMVVQAPEAEYVADTSDGQVAQPTVRIVQPLEGSIAEGRMAIVAEVAGQGFSYVAFEINGVLRSIATAAPYSYILNTEGCESGSYTVRVSAYDVMGTPLATTEQQFMVSHDAAPAR